MKPLSLSGSAESFFLHAYSTFPMASLWRVILALALIVFQVTCQGDEQAQAEALAQEAGDAQAQAAAAEAAAASAEDEDAPPPRPALTEEEQKQQEQLRKLYMQYVQRHLSLPCLEGLQGLFSAPEEERPAKEATFHASCGEEMQKRAWYGGGQVV